MAAFLNGYGKTICVSALTHECGDRDWAVSRTCLQHQWDGRAGPPRDSRDGNRLHQRHKLPDVRHQSLNTVDVQSLHHHWSGVHHLSTGHIVTHRHVRHAGNALNLKVEITGNTGIKDALCRLVLMLQVLLIKKYMFSKIHSGMNNSLNTKHDFLCISTVWDWLWHAFTYWIPGLKI